MKWISGQPIDKGYYLCAVVGNSNPVQLCWDGSGWFCSVEYESDESVHSSEVPYYMKLNDIPMPEGW